MIETFHADSDDVFSGVVQCCGYILDQQANRVILLAYNYSFRFAILRRYYPGRHD